MEDNKSIVESEKNKGVMDNNFYPIITPEEYIKNYNYGLANAAPYISKKNIRGKDLHYLSWAFAMRWLGSTYPHLQIYFEPEVGNDDMGYYAVGYIYNTRNGLKSASMELAVLDYSNKVINKHNEKNSILQADDVCNTRQRLRAKIVAIVLGMGAHLYEGFGDVLNENSKVNEEVKEQAQELVEENQQIQEQIKTIKYFAKRLKEAELESYVNMKLVNTMGTSELQKYSLSDLSDFAVSQKQYYGMCRLRYLMDQYKEKSGKEWALHSEKSIEDMDFEELKKEGAKVKKAVDELDSPGTE